LNGICAWSSFSLLFFNENISQQHMNITELPDDVLHEVFARLPCRDVLTLGAVNQHLASLSRADTLWSLLVRVAAAEKPGRNV
jgi:hypothetical protein